MVSMRLRSGCKTRGEGGKVGVEVSIHAVGHDASWGAQKWSLTRWWELGNLKAVSMFVSVAATRRCPTVNLATYVIVQLLLQGSEASNHTAFAMASKAR
jgi:hypothetical protein